MYEKFYSSYDNNLLENSLSGNSLSENNKNDIVIKSGYLHRGNYPNLHFDGIQRDIVYL
jgi:hypothetical protein